MWTSVLALWIHPSVILWASHLLTLLRNQLSQAVFKLSDDARLLIRWYGQGSWDRVPAGLDVVSMDGYCVGNESDPKCPPATEAQMMQNLYEQLLIPKLRVHQKLGMRDARIESLCLCSVATWNCGSGNNKIMFCCRGDRNNSITFICATYIQMHEGNRSSISRTTLNRNKPPLNFRSRRHTEKYIIS